jgi:DNA polymerase-3 subunit gamma/tau
MKWTSNKKLHLEIALIRAMHALSEVSLENVVDALEQLRGIPHSQAGQDAKSPPIRQATALKEPDQSRTAPRQIAEASPSAKSDPGELQKAEEGPRQTSETLLGPSGSLGPMWERVLREIRSRRPLIVSWIEPATPLFLDNGTLKLGFPKSNTLAVESLARPNNQKLLEEVVAQVLGGSWRIEFELRDDLSAGETKPAPLPPIDPMEGFKKDPMIQKALEIFKAEIQSDH